MAAFMLTGLATGCNSFKENKNSNSSTGQNYKYEYDNIIAATPFWNSGIMYNEAVLLIQEGDESPSGRLLFDAKKIISVRDYTLNKEYIEGKDYTYENGVIKLVKGASIPYMTRKQLMGEDLPATIEPMNSSRTETGKVFFSETPYLMKQQISVTYAFNKDDWKGEKYGFVSDKLPKTIAKLKEGKSLRLLVYGCSVAAGAGSSKSLNIAPKTPSWAELIKINLENKYKNNVFLDNPSVGGKMSEWGVENASVLAAAKKPDLAIISFGGNDGSGWIDPEIVTANIKKIMDTIREKNADTEFIIVATMLSNPDSDYDGNHNEQGAAFKTLEGEGAVVVDMGAVHAEMLKRKSYSSLSSNNINHPNDFLARVYAMEILSLLIES